jgi:tRNA nucleotidyltransferase (CCA-adding enzyme)
VVEVFPLERIPDEVKAIAARLREAGHDTWFVGGAVRDVLMELALGRPAGSGDFDLATAAPPETVRSLFPRTVPVGIEHGTVAVLDRNGVPHEVTTFRRDVATDGRHAVVAFGVSIDEDLARRDFTVNAVAVHPQSGAIKDPFGGRADIAARRLVAVGEAAERFREDYLRVLRGLRFAAVYGLEVERATWAALVDGARLLDHLSRERVRDEWLKTLGAAQPSTGVNLWRRSGALGRVWPELDELPDGEVGTLDEVEPRDPVLLTAAALWHAGAGADAAEAAVRRLRFANRDLVRVRAVVAGLASPLPAPGAARDLRRWLATHRTWIKDIIAVSEPRVRRGDLLAAVEATLASGDALSLHELAVTGDDLIAAGIPPGKAMGEILRRLLDEVLDEPWKNTRDKLLARARELAS